MVKTASTMLELGTPALPFSLKSTSGSTVSLEDFPDSKGLLVIFMCNHCPFVIHVAQQLAQIGKEYQEKGLAIVGINSNDTEQYPDDSFDAMIEEVDQQGYTFPYLFDETQETAKAYRAACTPDFFLFDDKMNLFYRGQLDSSRPQSGIPVTGTDLRKAMDAVLAGHSIETEQVPSIGCNIKWKPGNEPDYFKPSGIGS
ncbi:MAG: thioredoxin family protein [Planctomycetota bacterium]|jgi:thiol-disulfide isomerase/thioredoxin|nr:thioredoxin family protein [Planctomycetota bacterium]